MTDKATDKMTDNTAPMTIISPNQLLEALEQRLPINKVFIDSGFSGTGKKERRIARIIELCRQNRVVFQMVPAQTITRKVGADHQGIFAEISPIRFYTLDEILETIKTGLILVLDCINDTGNMGGIVRSAVAAEVDAIIVPRRNSAPINETVLKASAGSLMKAKIVQSKNLTQDLKQLKNRGFWVAGSVMESEEGRNMAYYDYDFTINTAIVMGNEHKGVSTLVKKNVDQLIYIPMSSRLDSLNVSAATAVILFEALRQKSDQKPDHPKH